MWVLNRMDYTNATMINPVSIVKRMITPTSKSGRNLTIDNSIPLSIDLFKNHRLTIVDTIRQNKREIPQFFLNTIKRNLNAIYLVMEKYTLIISYMYHE